MTDSKFQLSTWLSFFAIYVIWGSTFYAIRVMVATVPTLLAAGLRFFTAGVILYSIARLRGETAPTRFQWRNLLLQGCLLFVLTYSALFWAETIIPSGIASVLVSTLPMLTLLIEVVGFRSQKLSWMTAGAIVMGFFGILALTSSKDPHGQIPLLPCLAILGGESAWALGAVLSRRLDLPKSKAITAGSEMLLGGGILLLLSLLAGEFSPLPSIGGEGLLALLYLITAGSLIGFTAFVILLDRFPATTISSHAYVNPVIALGIGYWIGHETLGPKVLLGAGLVLISVVMILQSSKTGAKRATAQLAAESE